MSSLARDPQTAKDITAMGFEWMPAEPLSAHTSLGVGGRADVVRIHEFRRLPELMDYLERRSLPWRLLGGGPNLLVADQDLGEVVLQLARPQNGTTFDADRVEVAAGGNLCTTLMGGDKPEPGGMGGQVGV